VARCVIANGCRARPLNSVVRHQRTMEYAWIPFAAITVAFVGLAALWLVSRHFRGRWRAVHGTLFVVALMVWVLIALVGLRIVLDAGATLFGLLCVLAYLLVHFACYLTLSGIWVNSKAGADA
jgi:hypothetical protein